ncbi:ABA4-like family protein [Actinoplanes sp. GCM10030250]|uniref:ABA4-like family protein n=1 Tax=Actinoplanes sp. GCM10030250 TaxID=3273376 RepID=UPI00360C9AC1
MTESLFSLTFLLAAPFWALMILLPGWSWTRRVVSSPLIVLPIVAIYALLIIPDFGTVLSAVSSPTLDGVSELLGSPAGAAAGWAHMIAFDLFVGRWSWLDSRDRGVPALVMAPILLLTIMLGPLGLAAYLAVRPLGKAAAAVRESRLAGEETKGAAAAAAAADADADADADAGGGGGGGGAKAAAPPERTRDLG